MSIRKIVHIDEELCDGCGLCVPSCHEGAIAVVDGKARLVSDVYCDGLGACLGECPRDAIRVEEREAAQFDEKEVEERRARLEREAARPSARPPAARADHSTAAPGPEGSLPCGCPSATVRSFAPPESPSSSRTEADAAPRRPSALGHWPVKLALVPPKAAFLRGADLIVAADCAPFACADFHESFLAGNAVVIGCPKLDDAEAHRKKLAALFGQSGVRSVRVVHMEVPCCYALVHLVRQAMEDAGVDLPVTETVVGVRGEHGQAKPAGRDREPQSGVVASAGR